MGAGALDPTKVLGMEYFLKYKRGLEYGQPKKEEASIYHISLGPHM